MPVQDDRRERQLIELFELTAIPGRAATDAKLDYRGMEILFEIKSTTKGSVTTARDVGAEHIQKWKKLHWLIGFYDDAQHLKYSIYVPPQGMAPWIKEKEEYIFPDVLLCKFAPDLLDERVLNSILGRKASYSLSDARKIQKRQFTAAEYRDNMDMHNGYSSERMLDILRKRCRYLLERGATLNNPHIPETYFNGMEQITQNLPTRLRELVDQSLANKTFSKDVASQ